MPDRKPIPRYVLDDCLRRQLLVDLDPGVFLYARSLDWNWLQNNFLGANRERLGMPEQENLSLEDRANVYDLIWAYTRAGILARGATSDFQQNEFEGFRLTEEGKRLLEGRSPIPDDVEAYLDDLQSAAPQLDKTVLFYVQQAQLALVAFLPSASVVMLGCAAEHLVFLLAKAFWPLVPERTRPTYQRALDHRGTSAVWVEFRKRFDPIASDKLGSEHASVLRDLDRLFGLVQDFRNAGAHPTEAERANEAHARALLMSFRRMAERASLVLEALSGKR